MFWRSVKIKNFVAPWNFNIGVNGKILKCATSWKWIAHRIENGSQSETDENLGLVVLCTTCQKKIVALWHFNMGVKRRIVKYAISWKGLLIKWNGWKFGVRGPMYYICGMLFMSSSLSSVWDQSVHFAKFLMLRFSKGYCSNSFHSISTKLYLYVSREEI